MDSAFLKGLEQIKKADSELVVETIFQLSHSIQNMQLLELTVAKKTFDLFRSLSTMGEAENKILDQINEEMVIRGALLCDYAYTQSLSTDYPKYFPKDCPKDVALLLRSAFGDECYEKRLRIRIQEGDK